MNTRILRMCRIHKGRNHRLRLVQNMGQLQPVIFAIRDGQPSLRIEGIAGDRPCYWTFPLPRHKAEAKRAFNELEQAKLGGYSAPALAAWEAYQATQSA